MDSQIRYGKPGRIPQELQEVINRELKKHSDKNGNPVITKKIAMIRIANGYKELDQNFKIPKFTTEIKIKKSDMKIF